MIDRDELGAWLRLLETPQVGRDMARRLLSVFGSPQAVVAASAAARREAAGSSSAALDTVPQTWESLFESTWRWLASGEQRAVVTLGDPLYPHALLETADPPLLLYLQGRAELLASPSIAVVGSRNPTAQGVQNARAFARHLSQAGFAVVSGLALGIDGAAHEGALEGEGGTIAVVGTGLDRVYPKRHLDLAHRIAARGLMLSEFALGTPPLPQHFPMRNRLIAGLARGTLVVEAALESGSLITARLAAECGREVFAIPGSIHAPQSRGCHALIRQGAKLVDSAQDILEELRFPTPRQAGTPVSGPGTAAETAAGPDEPLLAALGHDPVTLDTLVDRTGETAAALSVRLLALELDGRVARLPGQLFQRIARG